MKLALKLPRRNPDAPRLSLRERYGRPQGLGREGDGPAAGRHCPPAPGRRRQALCRPRRAPGRARDGLRLCPVCRSLRLPDLAERRQAEEEAFRALCTRP